MNAAISPLRVLRTTGGAGTAVIGATLGRLGDVLVPADSGDGEPSAAAHRLPPIEFLIGRPTPSATGHRQIERLAEILSATPELVLHLQPSAGPADARWIAAHDFDDVAPSSAKLRRVAEARAVRAAALLTVDHRVPRAQVALEPETLGAPSSARAPTPRAADATVPGVAYWFTL